jgi:hypothetical protein
VDLKNGKINNIFHKPETLKQEVKSYKNVKMMIEIRIYKLKKGTSQEYKKVFTQESLPMLRRWSVNVIAYGFSLDDEDTFYLIRGYKDLDDRQQSQDAFYGSDEWRLGPREAIIACIESYNVMIVEADIDLFKKSFSLLT